MKQIRLLLVMFFFFASLTTYSQDCSVVKTLSDDQDICLGQDATITMFNSEVGVVYELINEATGLPVGVVPGDGSDINFTVTPSIGTTYYIRATCLLGTFDLNFEKVTINVTQVPVANATPASQNICSGGTTNIALSSVTAGTTFSWTVVQVGVSGATIGNGNVIAQSLVATGNVSGTATYTITPNNGCDGTPIVVQITVYPTSLGGNASVSNSSVVGMTSICHNGTGTIYLLNYRGVVLRWEYTINGGLTWVQEPASATSSFNYNIAQTRAYRAVVQNGICATANSTSVILNVIPAVIPNPVTANPSTICNGGSSTLSATSGWATSGSIADGGDFDTANPPGWLTDGDLNQLNAGGSNTNPTKWRLSASNGGSYSGVTYTSSNKFAIAHGAINSTLDTPVFNTLGLNTASLLFNHAFKLDATASAKVLLSLDGGATYPVTLLTYNGVATRQPYNNFPLESISLDSYVGLSNLRIRFVFQGTEFSSWAIDNIRIPDVPVGLTTQWYDGSGNVMATNVVSPSVDTRYSIVTFLNGCPSGVAHVWVYVNQRPTANLGPSQTICNSTPATFSIALTGTAPWKITYFNGSTSTTVSGVNTNPYVFTTPNLVSNTTYTITAVSDAKCSAIPADITNNAVVSVLNGTPGNWTGLIGTDWFDCKNWAGGGPNPPSITTDVVISNGRPNMPNINALTAKAITYSGIANARDITIGTAASLTMSNSSVLNIGKDWKNSGTFNPGNATVALRGATLNQVQLINSGIKLFENFYNLTLNTSGGAKGVILPNNFQLTVANHLTLQSGDLRLTDEAQLVQLGATANPVVGTGKLYRDQQGKKSSFHYNYWSSPVSNDNVNYTLLGNLKDGTDVTTNPFAMTNINFGAGAYYADGAASNPIKISNRWLYKYASSAPNYYSWIPITNAQNLTVGEGFIMKGCDGTVANSAIQNYVFVGKPNNGDINLTLGLNQTYLVGNPYPSSLDADKFIRDNIKDGGNAATNKFNGVLYFYDHFGGNSHILSEYEGGYAAYSLMGGVEAVSNGPMTANTGASGTKVPKRYIPVAQGFFIKSIHDTVLTSTNPNLSPITGGVINFKNSQRAFCTEASGNSLFFRTADPNLTVEKEVREKIRLQFISSTGITRQLLVGTDENASNNFDLGYDAPMIDVKSEDMYWNLSGNKLIIQGLDNFDEEQRIPFTIKTNNLGTFRIKIVGLENIDSSKEIYVFDQVTRESHNLRENDFVMEGNAGEFANRFSIRFSNPSAAVINANLRPQELPISYSKTDHSIHILNETDTKVKEVQIFNLLGQQVQKSDIENVFGSTIKIPVKNLANSTYIVKVITDSESSTKKIIIN